MEEINKIIEKLGIKSISEFKLTYDSPTQQLEPIYYWILDFVKNMGFDVEKLVDSFTASPGGGYFSEIGKKASVMQEKVMNYLGAVNQVIKSIINLLYDLKQFEIRLSLYDKLKSKNEIDRKAALNALKEIWITNVDIQKGRGAINVLTTQLEFVTLRDAFFVVKTPEEVDKLDLNERVKNILKSRIIEFNEWLKLSEIELRNRYKLEKNYLKSQVASLKLYSRWLKPYLKAAEDLMMKESKDAALVSAFSTLILNLLLQCSKKYTIDILPKELKEYFKKKKVRNFYGIIYIDFYFRSIPQYMQREGYYAFGGRVDLNFKSFVLNEDQFNFLKKELEKKEFEDIMKIFTDLTEESLNIMAEDLKKFLEEKEEEKESKEKKLPEEGIITDIFTMFKKNKEKKKEKKDKDKNILAMSKENYYEKYLRNIAEKEISELCFKVYDVFKKSKGMPSHPSPFE